MHNVLIAVLAFVISGAAYAALPDEVKALVDAGNYESAYQLASSNVDANEGDPTFDFNYGLAALQTGRFSEAVFALERVLLRFPDQQRVRLELARAHFGSGNLSAARREFTAVINTDPPEQVKRNINSFLVRIDELQRGTAQRSSVLLFAELASGYDSNVNSATDDGTVQLPGAIVVNLDKAGTEIDDGFVRIGAGVLYQRSVSPREAYDASAVVTRRELWSGDDFDLTFAQITGGLTKAFGDHRVRFGVRGLMVGLDTSRFQEQLGASVNWVHDHSSGYQLSASLAGALVNYDDDPLRDTRQALLTTGISRKLGMFTHSVNVFGALEPAENRNVGKHNGRNFGGVGYRGNWNISDKIAPFVRAQAQWTKYDDDHPVFGKERDDTYYTVAGGVTWTFLRNWILRGQVSYADQDSNLDVFSYDRFQVEAGVTYSMPR